MSSTGTSRRCAAIAVSPSASTSHRARRRNFVLAAAPRRSLRATSFQQVRADRVSGLGPQDAVVPRDVRQDTPRGEARLLVLDSRLACAADAGADLPDGLPHHLWGAPG